MDYLTGKMLKKFLPKSISALVCELLFLVIGIGFWPLYWKIVMDFGYEQVDLERFIHQFICLFSIDFILMVLISFLYKKDNIIEVLYITFFLLMFGSDYLVFSGEGSVVFICVISVCFSIVPPLVVVPVHDFFVFIKKGKTWIDNWIDKRKKKRQVYIPMLGDISDPGGKVPRTDGINAKKDL